MLRFISFSLATLYLGLASALAFLPISQTKTKLFVLQLLLLAPAVVCYGIYKIRQPPKRSTCPRIPRWVPYAIYVAMLMLLVWTSRLGAKPPARGNLSAPASLLRSEASRLS